MIEGVASGTRRVCTIETHRTLDADADGADTSLAAVFDLIIGGSSACAVILEYRSLDPKGSRLHQREGHGRLGFQHIAGGVLRLDIHHVPSALARELGQRRVDDTLEEERHARARTSLCPPSGHGDRACSVVADNGSDGHGPRRRPVEIGILRWPCECRRAGGVRGKSRRECEHDCPSRRNGCCRSDLDAIVARCTRHRRHRHDHRRTRTVFEKIEFAAAFAGTQTSAGIHAAFHLPLCLILWRRTGSIDKIPREIFDLHSTGTRCHFDLEFLVRGHRKPLDDRSKFAREVIDEFADEVHWHSGR